MIYFLLACIIGFSSCSRSSTNTTDYTADPTCPYLDYLTYDYYPGNCSKFYECEHGKKFLLDCPDGLYWNTNHNYCDYLENVDCSRSNTTTPSGTEDYTIDTTCPYLDYLTYDYYPSNCSKFYECEHGKRYLLDCPAGLYWNIKYDYCDYLENVDCSRGNATTMSSTSATSADDTGVTNQTIIDYTIDPTCPYLDDLTFDYYPGNCSKFYECEHGKRYLLDCPAGFYWNIKYNYCDYLENVDCSRGNATTSATSTDDTGVTNQTTTVSDYTIDPTCPYLDHLTYDYYPSNCSKFYECEHGKRYLLDCPAGFYWNIKYNYCDYLENVDCNRGNGTTMSSTSATSTDDSGVTNQTTTSATVTTTGPVCRDEPDGTFVANPTDCSKFYECTGGLPVEFSCPAGTLWDKERKVCDFPKNVDC